ncbi:biopolymer transport protein ExbB [Cupriavidus basilensis OR16]|uniref:Biopolymer transport protein ExbB n=1 Tax=Cupriavidus basilensis OR16 TaxID=1127483 RepID=H1S5F3_9BURK|nr:biopolymer transport protein ExbB [Cupriavidus basilensis OR16]
MQDLGLSHLWTQGDFVMRATAISPVGEALIMTAFGLAVAIPAVLGYNALTRGNKGVISKLNRFAHDLHAYFVTGARMRPTSARPDDTSVRLAVKNQ